jgi:hypothetical protein
VNITFKDIQSKHSKFSPGDKLFKQYQSFSYAFGIRDVGDGEIMIAINLKIGSAEKPKNIQQLIDFAIII